MKKYLLILCLLLPLGISAQTSIKEEFDGSSTLEWNEYADKHTSALIQNGCMMLKPHKARQASTKVKLPIETDYDFTVEAELFYRKFSNLSIFGILYNDAFNISVNSNKYVLAMTRDGAVNRQRIKLTQGKDVTIIVALKRTAKGLTITINNMEVLEAPIEESQTNPELTFRAFGVPLQIKSLTIEQ